MLHRWFLLSIAMLVLTAGVSAQEDVKAKLEYEVTRQRVDALFRSALPLPPLSVPKSIYGVDNRKDIKDLPEDDFKRKAAQSTCLLTNKSRVSKQGGKYILTLEDYRYASIPCCGSERFATQKVGGWCSGFLVGKNIVVTAGHCCEDTDTSVNEIAFVFGFAADAMGNSPTTIPESGVYFGKRLIKRRLNDGGDFAVIELDRDVTAPGAQPLKVAHSAPDVNDGIVLIGYPAGLPCKAADGAKVMEKVPGGAWLRTNVDAYGGNSGSAVIDSEGIVVGILVRGKEDFKIKSIGTANCFESIHYPEAAGSEILTRPEIFRGEIPALP